MKKHLTRTSIVVTLLFFGWLNADAADYYVSAAGNDAWDGKSAEYIGGTSGPWLTVDRVNQRLALPEGANILFHRDERFEGMLEIKGHNFRIGAYGEGERPILSAARTLTGNWSLVAGQKNVYQQQLPEDVSDVALLMNDRTSLPLGRTPNGDILTNDAFYTFSSRTFTTLIDPELSGAENLAGAELILRKNVWRYDPYPVTSVEGTVVNIRNNQKHTAKKGDENLQEAGYFFQKHLNTLDVDGEWFFDVEKHILYICSDENPNTKDYQYSVYPEVVNIVNSMSIALEGLKIEMAVSTGIKIENSQLVEVHDCEIIWCGQDGIQVEASSALIESNSISDCFSAGIRTSGEGRVVFTKNNVSNIGLIAGRGHGRNGIYLMGGNSEASYNRLTDIGYLGIQHLKGGNKISRNVIDRYNLVAFDGGAIYTHDDQLGSVVEENIILNGLPNTVGLGDIIADMEVPFTTGIQCDRGTENLIIRNNTISFPQFDRGPDRGIHINFNSIDNLFLGNTILVKGAGITTLDRDPYDRKPGEESPPSMSGNRFEENIIICTDAANSIANYGAMTCFSLKETEQCDVENQGLFLNNVCALPYKDSKVIYELHKNCNQGRTAFERWYSTAMEWNESRAYASGNLDAPLRIDESSASKDFIQLFYNDSDNPQTIQLPAGEFLDPRGKSVSASVSLAPWRSLVLFKKQ
ncbi:MAG: right-handed parallel beta-helix repeat-containing protein [Bacteroides sp.]|nr:right-handed parallel beta-helix repeat-containing protein [Bacteroides sp.]